MQHEVVIGRDEALAWVAQHGEARHTLWLLRRGVVVKVEPQRLARGVFLDGGVEQKLEAGGAALRDAHVVEPLLRLVGAENAERSRNEGDQRLPAVWCFLDAVSPVHELRRALGGEVQWVGARAVASKWRRTSNEADFIACC